MARIDKPLQLPSPRFVVDDPWRLVETEYDASDLGVTETLFALGNGYIGMRANPEEGREAHSHGTLLNGFHETWPIRHAEDAYGFATTGQTIVNVPDTKVMKIYVDDEPLLLGEADLDRYERILDFRTGTLDRNLIWRTPSGGSVEIRSRRLISFRYRHLAIATVEITALDSPAPVVISSQMLNRQDGEDEYHVRSAALGEGKDPRRVAAIRPPGPHSPDTARRDDGVILGYRCAESGMTLAVGYRHLLDFDGETEIMVDVAPDHAKTAFSIEHRGGPDDQADQGHLVPLIARRPRPGVGRSVRAHPGPRHQDRHRPRLRRPTRAGSTSSGNEPTSRSTDPRPISRRSGGTSSSWRQASARTQEQGIAAKGVTADGYEGHYFWDTEVYVLPFLAATQPDLARKLLRFRWKLLPMARDRAAMLNQRGALYPWRTINGEEASAYYAAGTAAYHINAAVAFAIERYMDATDDLDFLADEGAEILTETARLWEDLGFYAQNGEEHFRIHGVTGPDEYTTVVNDNLYTNVMARFNLRYAATTVERLRDERPADYERLCRRTGLTRARDRRLASGRDRDVPALRRGPRDPPPGRELPRA